jgi:hypothetical protein
MQNRAGEDEKNYLEVLGLAWGIGWRVAAGLFLGSFADSRLGTEPLFTLLCVLAAFLLAVVQLLRVLKRQSRDDHRT